MAKEGMAPLHPEGQSLPTEDVLDRWSGTPDSSVTSVTLHSASWESDNSTRLSFTDTAEPHWSETDYPDWELPYDAQAVLIALYSITTLLAVVGNILVIVVLVLGNRVKTELTVFIVNLAIADLIMAFFCMPFTFTKVMLGRWIFGPFMCTYVSFMQVTSVAISIFTNMAIGIDRFWGVMYPLKAKLSKTRAKVALLAIWFAAMTLASPQVFIAKSTSQMINGNRYWDCDEKWLTERSRHSYTLAVVSLTYILPLLVLCFTYYKVGTKLWIRNAPGNAHQSRDQIMLRSKRKVIKMLVTLVAVFAVCWLPLHLFILLLDFVPHLSILLSPTEEHIFFGIYYSCHWLAMANSFVNPIIYSFLNESFRADLKMLCSWLPCDESSRDPPTETLAYTMSTRSSRRTAFSRVGSRNSRPLACGTTGRTGRTRTISDTSASTSSLKCMFKMQSEVASRLDFSPTKATSLEDSYRHAGTNDETSYQIKLLKAADKRADGPEELTNAERSHFRM